MCPVEPLDFTPVPSTHVSHACNAQRGHSPGRVCPRMRYMRTFVKAICLDLEAITLRLRNVLLHMCVRHQLVRLGIDIQSGCCFRQKSRVAQALLHFDEDVLAEAEYVAI